MFKHFLLRSLAGATAVGSALALSLAATPAVTTAAPEIHHVAYPGSVSTTTKLTLSRSIGAYGSTTRATATVTAGRRTPVGAVRFTLSGGGTSSSWTTSLDSGRASISLPRRLPAGVTYTVRAKYLPKSGSVFRTSSAVAYYTVKKAGTTTSVSAPDVRRTERSKVNVTVRSSTIAPTGSVRIQLLSGGILLTSKTVSLLGGRVSTTFGRLRTGYYQAKVTYPGTSNFGASSGSDSFRVTR